MLVSAEILDQYQALIFDMDGTIIDTMPSHAKAWEITGEHFGYQVDSSVMYELGGATTYTIGREIMQRANMPMELLEEVVQMKRKIAMDLTYEHSSLLPAFEIIQYYSGKKPLAVGTGAHRIQAYKLLDKFNLRPYFNTIVDADDVKEHKPSPETFLLCAERLGVDPQHYLVFEDADLGIQAALAGGMDVFDVRTNQITKAR
ncbi:beta-phosphoglucomutase family hydrolase [Actinobacillus genomosp. 1]|uniref:beta-phosphoglucomutase family hydrolase n=1 Tax=Actinobacillus genomosp. 1 TaxID=254839 RepID=UPI0024423917|nr:beta-phosphoglucomutase family hydrolase [Actinobacillus genomosp. 1]WGE36192.1 beta-phosphoglucomutase family hydrolase [Actinobacillus genomosp. 1]